MRSRPEVRAELLPHVPDVQVLLSAWRAEVRLALLMALLALGVGVTGVLSGGLLFVRRERARVALDRALGLSARRLTRLWWLQTLGLGLLCVLAGGSVGYALTIRLYNALSLAAPGWPTLEAAVLHPGLVLLTVLVLLAASTAGVLLAARWVRRQALLPHEGR